MDTFSVRVVSTTPEQAHALQSLELDLKYRAARSIGGAIVVPGLIDAAQKEMLEARGYTVEVEGDADAIARERLAEVSPANRFADSRSLDDFDARTILGYMTAAEVESALAALAAANPALVTLITLPFTTWKGRTSHAVRLRAGASPAARPGVLFTGSMHAREWGGSDILVSFAVKLVDAYKTSSGITYGGKTFTAAQVKNILEQLDVFVFPDVNPDGKEFSQTTNPGSGSSQSTWWRKNRNPNGGSASKGVDLNRNFDFLWASGIGTSTTLSSFTYRGTAPFSEPEARNVKHLMDANPGIRYFVDVHSHGQLILYNWGDDNNQHVDTTQHFGNAAFDGVRGVAGDSAYREFITSLDHNTAVAMGERMNAALQAVRGVSYTVQQAVGLYATSATSDDYAFSRHIVDSAKQRVYGYTIEFGTQFVPPWPEMQLIVADVGAAITELCVAATADVFIRDNDADTGDVPSAGPFWNSPDVWVRNADDDGLAHQATIRGSDNWIYTRVRNRGVAEAVGVRVRVCISTFAGTEFVYPGDWIPTNPAGGGSLGVPGTYLVGEATIASIPPGGSAIAKVRWDAALIPPAAGWHPCLLVECSPASTAPTPGAHVWHRNNLAQKNITVVDAAAGRTLEYRFRIASEFSKRKETRLVVRRVDAPAATRVYLDLADLKLTRDADEEPAEARLVESTVVALHAPPLTRDGERFTIRLPAQTQITLGRPIALASSFEPVTIAGKKLLALPPRLTAASVRLPELRKPRDLALRIAVPKQAPAGPQTFEIVQYDGRRAVGGVVVQVNVE